MTPRRIEVRIERLVVDGRAPTRAEVGAALERELARLVRGDVGGSRAERSPWPAVAREVHRRLGR